MDLSQTSQEKARRVDPRLVTRADHDRIQAAINLQGEEDYCVTVQKGKGTWVKTVHVFARGPQLHEINRYEQTASKVKFKSGGKAELEGSQITAATTLYDLLIGRAYNVVRGARVIESVDRDGARTQVPPLTKREAIRELIGEVYSASRMEEVVGSDDDDASASDSEEHTSPPSGTNESSES